MSDLPYQGTLYGVWFFIDHQEKQPCWSLWLTSALLPIPDRAEFKAVAPSKCDLSEAQALSNGLDIHGVRDTDRVCLSTGGIPLGVGESILQSGKDTIACGVAEDFWLHRF